ncbi:MAG: hypothetical protein HY908_30360 [Myxococcales bacterium]|nr:hypothetical protein [Myxococcales bacterium]
MAPFWWLSNGKRTSTVTADGKRMIKGSFDLDVVPHLPGFAPIPHVTEWAVVAWVIAMSSSKPALMASTVTGQGEPLAVCLDGPAGLNIDCGAAKAGPVCCHATVVTEPTLEDCLGMALAFGVAFGLDFLAGKLAGAAGTLLKGQLGKLLAKMLEQIPEAMRKTVLKDLIKRILKFGL